MYGFSGITDVNDGFLSMSLQRRGTSTFSGGLCEVSALDNDIIVISNCNGDIVQLKKNGGNVVLYSQNATRVDYLIFNTNTAKTSGYGIETYDSHRRVIFSSNHKFLRPIKAINTNLNRGFFTESTPYGHKYGVILSNYGFRIDITPDYCRRIMRSVKVDGSISFGSVTYESRGIGRIGITYNDDSFFANAIIVDITGY